MLENSSNERITEVLRRLLSIQDVIAPEHFDALTWTLMKAIGAEAMAEAERRSFLLHEPPPRKPRRCKVIPFPMRGMAANSVPMPINTTDGGST